MPTDAQWKVLSKLFPPRNGSFRHHLGLSRVDPRDFYAPTAEAGQIRLEKQAILSSPVGDRHRFHSTEGVAAFEEFTSLIGCGVNASESDCDRQSLHRAVTLAIEPDWILLSPADWKLISAGVCFPTRWSLEGKGLQPLSAIHAIVPGLNAELGRKIDVFFNRLEPGEGWGRANWGLSTSPERNLHPGLPYRPLSDQTLGRDVYVRLESQHLLKLPGKGAIAFGIRILSFSLEAVAGRPEIHWALKEQLQTMPAEVAAYKGIPPDFWRRL